MVENVARTAAIRAAFVLLLMGAAACTAGTAGSGVSVGPVQSTGGAVVSAAPALSAPPAFPEEVQRRVLAMAEGEGRSPGVGALLPVRWSDEEVPRLLWQAAASKDLCMATPVGASSASMACEKASEILAAPSPGVRWILPSALNDHQDGWNLVLLASDETLEEISCGTQDFPTRMVLSTTIGGVTRTVYTVTVPRTLGGTYRANVQRAGQVVPDTVEILAEGRGQC